MADFCSYLGTIRKVTPGSKGGEGCLKQGWERVHLRLCRIRGHIGCCDQSRGKHATKHFLHTRHPIIEGYDPPEEPVSRFRNSPRPDNIHRANFETAVLGPVPCRRSDVQPGR